MTYKKFISILAIAVMGYMPASVFAFMPKETARYFNGPSVTNITSTKATFTIPDQVLKDLTADEKAMVYFQYTEPEKACIMIYPTPESCLPKKTDKGVTSITVTNLTPNTKYSVVYKSDNTIRCITAPCPSNEFESLSVEFTTKKSDDNNGTHPIKDFLVRTFGFKYFGADIKAVQDLLIQRGFMTGTSTGYFGVVTFKAIKDFQRSVGIVPTGFVGPLTKKALNDILNVENGAGEKFSGKVSAVSTSCFADGECSITVDGKKVVTTIGWRQAIELGSIKGVPSIGDAEKCIGSNAEVYAKKTEDGYTLYGNNDYYVNILNCKI